MEYDEFDKIEKRLRANRLYRDFGFFVMLLCIVSLFYFLLDAKDNYLVMLTNTTDDLATANSDNNELRQKSLSVAAEIRRSLADLQYLTQQRPTIEAISQNDSGQGFNLSNGQLASFSTCLDEWGGVDSIASAAIFRPSGACAREVRAGVSVGSLVAAAAYDSNARSMEILAQGLENQIEFVDQHVQEIRSDASSDRQDSGGEPSEIRSTFSLVLIPSFVSAIILLISTIATTHFAFRTDSQSRRIEALARQQLEQERSR